MTLAGWIIMLAATGGITTLLGWCVYKVVSTPGSTEHLHSPVDIETGDRDDS
jgi:hypothetical protein